MRKALAQPGKTGGCTCWTARVERPLLGIEERPVPQEPRQATSLTQPVPVGDAFVPQSMSIAPEGFPLVNEGRIFTPSGLSRSWPSRGRAAAPTAGQLI